MSLPGSYKNSCVCPEEAARSPKAEGDARILVSEWRLQSVQSPIHLSHRDSNEYDHFEPLEFHGHWDKDGSALFTNTGYTANLTFKDRDMPVLKGGPLHDDVYVFEQLHFHWSDDDGSGCEHIFEGRSFSMEAHIVHYNKKYKTFAQAAEMHDGLAVVAFYLQSVDDFENAHFKKLSDAAKKINKIQTTTPLDSDCLGWFKEWAGCKGYYTYQGSLTTEPYHESVTWILYPTPIPISSHGASAFRNLKSTPCEQYTISKNIRPVQTPSKKLEIYYARSHKTTSL